VSSGWAIALRLMLASMLAFGASGIAAADESIVHRAHEPLEAAEPALKLLLAPSLQSNSPPAQARPSETTAAVRLEPAARPSGAADETSQAVRIVVGLTALAILPALLVCLTAFLRIIIVLSMLRHAIGMPETPPNTVLLGLALFLTLFTMSPVLHQLNQDALQPFMAGKLGVEAVYDKGSGPIREFMVRQTREQDLALMVELSKAKRPESMADISNVQLIPAFMLSELRAAFQIGFVIFLPFLLIDLIVSSVLMALGMMMMPPTTVALPLKILMFILVDGWSVVLKALTGSFH
jgi:flagellar biosynthetic protein FliP